MLSCIDQANAFDIPENKKDLMQPVRSYFQTAACRNLFKIPLITNSIWSITSETIEVLPVTIHEEALTR